MGINKSPAGAHQWKPVKNGHAPNMTPDAHIKGKKNLPMMQTTDLSMRFDPEFGRISKHFITIQMNLLTLLQSVV